MKVDIQKFRGDIRFNLQKVQMRAILIQHGLWKVLLGPQTKPNTMTEEQWAEQKKKKCGSLKDYEWEELREKTVFQTVVLGATCLTRGA